MVTKSGYEKWPVRDKKDLTFPEKYGMMKLDSGFKISVQKRKKGAFLWQEKIWLSPSAVSMGAEEQKSEKS